MLSVSLPVVCVAVRGFGTLFCAGVSMPCIVVVGNHVDTLHSVVPQARHVLSVRFPLPSSMSCGFLSRSCRCSCLGLCGCEAQNELFSTGLPSSGSDRPLPAQVPVVQVPRGWRQDRHSQVRWGYLRSLPLNNGSDRAFHPLSTFCLTPMGSRCTQSSTSHLLFMCGDLPFERARLTRVS